MILIILTYIITAIILIIGIIRTKLEKESLIEIFKSTLSDGCGNVSFTTILFGIGVWLFLIFCFFVPIINILASIIFVFDIDFQ